MKNAWHRYWHELEISRARLATLRVAFFGLLGFDFTLVTLLHAPRYGAGGLNASHLPFLDPILPTPTPALVGAIWLLGSFLSLRAALGVAVRASAIGTAVCYCAVYYWSQADSYQHHYLVTLLLILFAVLPTGALELPRGDEPRDAKHWGLRMIYVQLAFLYFWAGFAKIDGEWLSGRTMEALTRGPEVRAMMFSIADKFGIAHENIFAWSAWGVMLAELLAAALLLWRRFWWLGLLMIPWFHVMVEVLDFDIEWFSYYMLALLFILLCPRRVVVGASEAFASVLEPLRARLASLPGVRPLSPTAARGAAVGAAAGCVLLALQAPVEGAGLFAVTAGLLAAAAPWPFSKRVARPVTIVGGQLLAMGAVLGSLLFTEVPYDYYRMWGGDLRRRGELEASAEAYEKANALKPEGKARWFHLGKVYEQLGRHEEALAAYETTVERYERTIDAARRAVHRAPTDAEAHFELGELHHGLSDRCARLARAKRRAGDNAAVADLTVCARSALEEAERAFRAGLEHDPRSGRGRSGLNRVLRQRRGR